MQQLSLLHVLDFDVQQSFKLLSNSLRAVFTLLYSLGTLLRPTAGNCHESLNETLHGDCVYQVIHSTGCSSKTRIHIQKLHRAASGQELRREKQIQTYFKQVLYMHVGPKRRSHLWRFFQEWNYVVVLKDFGCLCFSCIFNEIQSACSLFFRDVRSSVRFLLVLAGLAPDRPDVEHIKLVSVVRNPSLVFFMLNQSQRLKPGCAGTLWFT